ncbi:hypothetical protein M0805_005989 [Coniferiporia weirii]|nr:hypothetical protein M0805_005989 [Coniferiporia weirii]
MSASSSSSSRASPSGHNRTSSELQNIPVEIFYHILENVPRNSLTSVARANTSFNEVSEKLIYRHLELTTIPQALQCFQSLQKKPPAAQSVREFVVMINGAKNHVADLGPRLSFALRSLPQLTELHLAIEGPYLPALNGCTFPRLTTFSSIADLNPDWTPLADFLSRHPSITSLCLGGDAPGPNPCTVPKFELPPGSLPALTSYMGSRRLVSGLIPTRPVKRVTLAWHAPNVELEVSCVVPPLALSSVPIQSFSVATPGWSSDLARALAVYLPAVQSLRLHNVSADYHNEADIFTTLVDVLPSFTQLTRLELPCHRSVRSILVPDTEARAAKLWATRALRLQTVVFPSARTWRRTEKGVWVQMQTQTR